MVVQWPNYRNFKDDKDQDMPNAGEPLGDFRYRVSDLGFPISEEGMQMVQKLRKEQEKRDQDGKGMFIYNDWNGQGMSELMENFVSCTIDF